MRDLSWAPWLLKKLNYNIKGMEKKFKTLCASYHGFNFLLCYSFSLLSLTVMPFYHIFLNVSLFCYVCL